MNPFDSPFPTAPGVYLMKDAEGAILYVGKANNLRLRLRQYVNDPRMQIPYLIAQVVRIDTIITLTEKEALLLENTLIKRHKPKYNVLLKDDKMFVSLVVTEHEWPMIRLVRHREKGKGTYFGPYTSAHAARQTLDLISRLFPLRQCSDAELANRTRPCLLYDIKRCIAPCVHKCSKQEYQSHVEQAQKLLRGQNKEVLQDLKKAMEQASQTLEFEKAAEYKKMIEQIKHVTEVQHVDHPDAIDVDCLGLHREADAVLIALLMFREGKLIGSEHFSFHFIASHDSEILESFLLQHYTHATPKEILLPLPLEQKSDLEEILKTTLTFPQRGSKKDLIEMAMKNAQALFIREQDARSLKEKMLLDLQETLRLTRFPRRIECLDTSNISGSDPVASLITYVNGEKDKSSLRLFKTTGFHDDYSAMRHVLERHFKKAKEKSHFPDLLIVDGGKGQLHIALEVLRLLEIATIDVIALTKEEARHDKGLTQEKIYLPTHKDPLLIDKRSPLLFLLQKIRDDAHAAAISFHRKRRSKRTLTSALDDIPGIGPIKKKRLLTRFGSVKALLAANDEEILSVKGITKRDLERIRGK